MSKKNKSQKFKNNWSNQTGLGKKFGLSAIAVGKILIESGLKDSATKLATSKALSEGWAKSTPLKDGTPYFMWNTEKLNVLISKDHKPLNKVEYWVNEVKKMLEEANKLLYEGNDKLGYMLADTVYDDVPKDVLKEVRDKIEHSTIPKLKIFDPN